MLRHPALQIGMNANWYGALGEKFKERIGRVGDSEMLSGIIGSPADHHPHRSRSPKSSLPSTGCIP